MSDKPDPSPSGASAANAPDVCELTTICVRPAVGVLRAGGCSYRTCRECVPPEWMDRFTHDGCTNDADCSVCWTAVGLGAAPRQPEWLQDLTDAEIATAEKLCPPWSTEGRALAEVKRRRAQPAAAAPLVALRLALEPFAAQTVELSPTMEDDRPLYAYGNSEKLTVGHFRRAAAALAAAPRDERPDALWHLKRVTDYLDSANILLRDDHPEDADECDEAAAVVAEARAYLAAAAPIGAPDARPEHRSDCARLRGLAVCVCASPAAASLEVEALDAKLVEIQTLCRNDELDFDPRSGIDRLAADARAVLRRSGRHD